MADRSLRGMRIGSHSLQSEEGVEFSPRKTSVFRSPDGSTFEVTFAAEADVPEVWQNPKTGREGRLVDADGELVQREETAAKTPRTHWDMLLERRTTDELEELLQERLSYLRSRRGKKTA